MKSATQCSRFFAHFAACIYTLLISSISAKIKSGGYSGPQKDLDTMLEKINPQYKEMLSKCLQKNISDRFTSQQLMTFAIGLPTDQEAEQSNNDKLYMAELPEVDIL